MGTIAPPSPAPSATAVVSVLTLPNGQETAQAIQSFAAGGSDFRSVSISAADAIDLRNFITSGDVTTTPTPPSGWFVSADAAVNNALKYAGADLSAQPVSDVNALLSGKTFFSISTFTASNGTVFPNANTVYFAPRGTYRSICINTVFDGLTANPSATNNGQPVSGGVSWAVDGGAQNTFTVSGFASCADCSRRYAFQPAADSTLAYGWMCPGGYVGAGAPSQALPPTRPLQGRPSLASWS
jgi:hypothetical protein